MISQLKVVPQTNFFRFTPRAEARISMIFKERNEFELALKYMTFAFKARINPQILGGNQE